MRELDLTLGGHERFVALCALYPTGSLSATELALLRNHLEDCDHCRGLLANHRGFHQDLSPLLLQERQQNDSFEVTGASDTKQKLFDAIGEPGSEIEPVAEISARMLPLRLHAIPSAAIAAVLLMAMTGMAAYFIGFHRGVLQEHGSAQQENLQHAGIAKGNTASSDAHAQQESALTEQVRERDDKISRLSSQIGQLSGQMALLKAQLEQANAVQQRATSDPARAQKEQAALAANRDALQAEFDASQSSLNGLQAQLRRVLDERNSDLMRTVTLQQKNEQLIAAMNEKDARIQEQQSLLNSDRDIRELMGARDLFIADVFDVARDGKSKSPYGRVFYTKNKSLVFYAFDLDKQLDVQGKRNVAFQVWGLNDSDKHHPLNLGIFYVDNQANKRWALRSDDAAVLERINSVFVTVEPNGGSSKPSGKQFLYAYLEAQPNHP